MSSFGYNLFSSSDSLKDLILIQEAIKSAMNRIHKLDHALQTVADESFAIEMDSTDGLEDIDDISIIKAPDNEPVD